MTTDTCGNCGATYSHRKDRQRPHCVACKGCGKAFTPKSTGNGGWSVYCSIPCGPGRPADPAKEVERICPGCGVAYRTKTWRLALYCSAKCRSESTKETRTCGVCGEGFTFYKSWPKLYCSQECYASTKFKGGKVYYGGNWAKQRALAIARDGVCVDCGAARPLHVHHLTAVREFDGDWQSANQLGNLVTVCRDCHVLRHGGDYNH